LLIDPLYSVRLWCREDCLKPLDCLSLLLSPEFSRMTLEGCCLKDLLWLSMLLLLECSLACDSSLFSYSTSSTLSMSRSAMVLFLSSRRLETSKFER
jgi:hypothetical protein